MIKNATFVSKVDMDTGEVFDIEQVDVSGIDLNSLDYESVIIDGVEHDIFYDGELQMYFAELNYEWARTMNEHITKQMIKCGLWQDVIKIRFEDKNTFIITIGDNWFYSGGQSENWRSASSIFDLVGDGIFETLESFRNEWDLYGDEYLYYYYYLTENIR